MPMIRTRINHADLINVLTSQHHTLYTGAQAIAAVEAEPTLYLTGVLNAKLQKIETSFPSVAEIVGGVATVSEIYMKIDTEDDDATDDLDTLNPTTERMIVILQAYHSNRTVVVKHGTGNIYLDGGVDFSLDHSRDKIMLIYNDYSANWNELCRSNNF